MGIKRKPMGLRLRDGETVVCPICHNGEFKPMYSKDVSKETHFVCDNCGEKLILNLRKS